MDGLDAYIASALRCACLEQKLRHATPHLTQDIVEEGLENRLRWTAQKMPFPCPTSRRTSVPQALDPHSKSA